MQPMLRFVLILCGSFLFSAAASADQIYKLAAFNAIKSNGVFNVDIVAGKAQTVSVQGSDELVQQLKLQVVDGQLMIDGPQEKHNLFFGADSNAKVVITLPSLRLFKGQGVGEINIKQIDGDRIDISYDGVGSVVVTGKTKWLRLKGNGVGGIDTKKLLAEDADVDFDGVGSVDIYVSNHLNAVVHGVGSLTYYGNPRSINKLADGVGSISAGK